MNLPFLSLKDVTFTLPHKICFSNFSGLITYGARIGLIGANGSGKSSLLKILSGELLPSEGTIFSPEGTVIAYVPQLQSGPPLSGGEQFNKDLTNALKTSPDILLLDEPTNHLDRNNRENLFKLLTHFPGTLLIASHDVELLRTVVHTIWHIEEGMVHIFSGNYEDYLFEKNNRLKAKIDALARLEKRQVKMRTSLQQEQKRGAQSQRLNAQENDRSLKGKMKETGSHTAGKNRGQILEIKKEIDSALQDIRIPDVLSPKFYLKATGRNSDTLISISEGCIGYDILLVQDIHLTLYVKERIAIGGKNGSGKSTILKGILNDPSLKKEGRWVSPPFQKIGYLDQNYRSLSPDKTVLETLQESVPSWDHAELRRHLNDFLFRKNEEVFSLVSTLSGGERCRLSLALIAAHTPQLLLLDEPTNNLDLETRAHVIQVLKAYPGALLLISHDEDFLKEIGVEKQYAIEEGKWVLKF